MATDATGTPTALGIPKYNTSVDAPSGLGFNAAMDTIDSLIAARVKVTGTPADADVPVWDNAAGQWKPSSVKAPTTLAGTVVTATSVAGLGTATPGKLGRLRLGSSPYTYVDLAYDSTTTKWTSPAQLIISTGTDAPNVAYFASTANNDAFREAVLPAYGAAVTAGLQLQLRIAGAVLGTSSSTLTTAFGIWVGVANVGDSVWTSLGMLPGAVTGTFAANNTWVFGDTDWQSVGPAGSRAMANIAAMSLNGGHTVEFQGSIWYRWISQ